MCFRKAVFYFVFVRRRFNCMCFLEFDVMSVIVWCGWCVFVVVFIIGVFIVIVVLMCDYIVGDDVFVVFVVGEILLINV